MSSIPAAEDDLVCQEGSGVSAAAVMADSVLSESMTHQQVVESLTKFNQRVSFTNNRLLKLTEFLHKLSPSILRKKPSQAFFQRFCRNSTEKNPQFLPSAPKLKAIFVQKLKVGAAFT